MILEESWGPLGDLGTILVDLGETWGGGLPADKKF